MNLLFLDTETTGLSNKDRLIQVAWKLRSPLSLEVIEPRNEYFKPPVPISFDSMATHHVTNEFIAEKPSFDGSECKRFLLDHAKDSILVAHNAPFDMRMLEAEGVEFRNFIDTQRVAMHLIESDSYKMQYLRYSLDLKVRGTAHDALGDVNVLIGLFDHLYKVAEQYLGNSDSTAIIDKMITLSVLPISLKKLTFGKYFGKTFDEVKNIDKGYLRWLKGAEEDKLKNRNEDLIYTLGQYV